MSRKTAIIFTVLVVAQLLMLVHYMQIRTSLFYDEIWSYGMANSYDSPFLYENGYKSDKNDSFYNHWIEGKRYFEYITVQPDERFSYGKVYDNQMADMHPPLYYIILHTICSFYPNTFSRWYGQIICLIVFVFVQYALYKLAKLFFDNEFMALIMCAYFGFSIAAVNNFIYIRMYCLVTLWYICITYMAIKICKAGIINKYDGWLLLLLGFLGFMTHNHFAIYYFCLCLACGTYFIFGKNFKVLWQFAGLALLSFIAYYSIFPGIFKQASALNIEKFCGGIPGPFPIQILLAFLVMIFNYTVAFPADKFFGISTDIVNCVGSNWNFLPVWLFLIIWFVLEGFLLLKQRLNKNWLILFFTVFAYTVILSSYTLLFRNGIFFTRYLFSILPCFAFLCFGIIYRFLALLKSNLLRKSLFYILMMTISFSTHYASTGEWCFETPPHREEIAERFKDASIIYVIGNHFLADPLIHGKCQDFMYAKRVFATRLPNIESIRKAIKECDLKERNLIILPATDEGKEIFKIIKSLTNREPVYQFTDNANTATFYVLQL